MTYERLTGILFFIAIFLFFILYILSPQPKYSKPLEIDIPDIEQPTFDTSLLGEPVKDIDTSFEPLDVSKRIGDEAAKIKVEDFNLFVFRVNVFSSFENASKLVMKINENGYPAFVEPLKTNPNLHAVYVGPFISENEIKKNIVLINKIAETEAGVIIPWNPSV